MKILCTGGGLRSWATSGMFLWVQQLKAIVCRQILSSGGTSKFGEEWECARANISAKEAKSTSLIAHAMRPRKIGWISASLVEGSFNGTVAKCSLVARFLSYKRVRPLFPWLQIRLHLTTSYKERSSEFFHGRLCNNEFGGKGGTF